CAFSESGNLILDDPPGDHYRSSSPGRGQPDWSSVLQFPSIDPSPQHGALERTRSPAAAAGEPLNPGKPLGRRGQVQRLVRRDPWRTANVSQLFDAQATNPDKLVPEGRPVAGHEILADPNRFEHRDRVDLIVAEGLAHEPIGTKLRAVRRPPELGPVG